MNARQYDPRPAPHETLQEYIDRVICRRPVGRQPEVAAVFEGGAAGISRAFLLEMSRPLSFPVFSGTLVGPSLEKP